ncbi:MAG: helix-turn-helix transcriptional regulator [Pirellulales bacterium]
MTTTNDNSNSSCTSLGKQQPSPRPDGPNVDGIAGPLLLTAKQAASACGKSLRTWRTWDAAGRIPRPVRIGRSTLWRADELRRWVLAGCPRRAEWEGRTC